MQVCRTHKLVQKNDLSARLIAPMQHQCHYQLLFDVRAHSPHTPHTSGTQNCCLMSSQKILRYTKDHSEKSLLSSAIKAFVVSLSKTLTLVAYPFTPSPFFPLTLALTLYFSSAYRGVGSKYSQPQAISGAAGTAGDTLLALCSKP